jgi:hypothetical protein
MPLIMASTATSPCDSQQSEGMSKILVKARIDVREVPGIRVPEVVDREDDRDAPVPGDGDHALRDRITAVCEQDIGPEDVEKLGEESQHRLHLFPALRDVPGGRLANEGDRDPAPAGIQYRRLIDATNRRTNIERLVQIADHLLEADFGLQVQLGRSKSLALEAPGR